MGSELHRAATTTSERQEQARAEAGDAPDRPEEGPQAQAEQADAFRTGPAVGERLPPIVAVGLDGSRVNVQAASAGRAAVVVVHRSAVWCPASRTQLVELQRGYRELRAAGVDLYALSYDEPDALADFARAHGITYGLLSDPESVIIRRLGILNTLVDPDDHPWFGIPFPGTYVLDRYGFVTDKFFERDSAVRPGWRMVLRAATGRSIEPPPVPVDPEQEVAITIEVEADEIAPGILHELVVRLALPAGQYVYGEPAPEGLTPLQVVLHPDSPGLLARSALTCDPTTRTEAGRSHLVYDRPLVMTVPLTHDGSATVAADGGGAGSVAVRGSVRWQACDEEGCGVPRRRNFEFLVPAGVNPVPDIGCTDGPGHRPMNGDQHFERLRTRRS